MSKESLLMWVSVITGVLVAVATFVGLIYKKFRDGRDDLRESLLKTFQESMQSQHADAEIKEQLAKALANVSELTRRVNELRDDVKQLAALQRDDVSRLYDKLNIIKGSKDVGQRREANK